MALGESMMVMNENIPNEQVARDFLESRFSHKIMTLLRNANNARLFTNQRFQKSTWHHDTLAPIIRPWSIITKRLSARAPLTSPEPSRTYRRRTRRKQAQGLIPQLVNSGLRFSVTGFKMAFRFQQVGRPPAASGSPRTKLEDPPWR